MRKGLVFLIMFLVCLNVHAKSGDVIYLNLTTTGSITITNGSEIKLNKSNTITINDFSVYQSVFTSGDSSKYPLYIIDNNGSYTFSDYKRDGTNVYMLSTKVLSIVTNSSTTNITNCESLFGYQLINLLKNNIFKLIYILIPIVLIVTTTFDFAKLVFSDDKDGIPGAFRKFSKRVIAAVLIFLTPTILIFLTTLLGSDEVKTCVETFKTTANTSNNA